MQKIRLLFFIIPAIFSYYVYESSSVIDYLTKTKLDEYYYRMIKKSISSAFKDAYVYNEISANPPQPNFNNNYHQKIDIQKSINEINQTNINVYNFYQELKKRISDLKDLNIDIKNHNKHLDILSNLYLACPIDFVIKKDNNNLSKLYCSFNANYKNIFEKEIINEIKENMNSSIVSINGKDPYDYIINFGGNINSGKNPHATFSNKFNTHNGENLATYPLNKEDLNMEIIFQNGKKLNIKYVILSENKIKDLNSTLLKKYDYRKIKIKNKERDDDDNSIFDFFHCRIDNENKINIFSIDSLASYEIGYSNSEKIFYKCVKLFDKNNYPIVIIFNKNFNCKGYYHFLVPPPIPFIQKFFIEFISPLISVKYYKAEKINEMSNIKIQVEYGDNKISYFSEPLDLPNNIYQILISGKKHLKNKRKPTDILIYTDGNTRSFSSLLIKSLQYYGGGIVAGYFGIPNKKDIPFDSAQSSSEFISQERFLLKSGGYKELYEKYNISIEMPETSYFYGDFDFKNPLEYSVTPIDERVEIYQDFNYETYQIFVDEAKKILEKYKTECNPKNKKLVFVTYECDNKFENNYTHGGYECGDDGKWTKKCIPSYCDDGYAFSYTIKKCVSIMEKVDLSHMIVKHVIKYQVNSFIFYHICLFISIFILFGSFLYFSIFKKKNKNKHGKGNEYGEELINIQA